VNIQFISTLHDVLVFFVLFNANLTFSQESHSNRWLTWKSYRNCLLENIVRVFLRFLHC